MCFARWRLKPPPPLRVEQGRQQEWAGAESAMGKTAKRSEKDIRRKEES